MSSSNIPRTNSATSFGLNAFVVMGPHDDLLRSCFQLLTMQKRGDLSGPSPPYTVVATTPLVREKPFLFVDGGGNYLVMVPNLKAASRGSTWGAGAPPGPAVSIDRFYVAKPGSDTAATMNGALSQGKHLLLTPG